MLKKFPTMVDYIGPQAEIIKHPEFENAIVKLQSPDYQLLTEDESVAVRHFLIEVPVNEIGAQSNTMMSPAEITRAKRQKISNYPEYRSVAHIRPTSNIVERLFSQASCIMTDERKNMNPEHLDELLIVKYHRCYWEVDLVEKCMNSNEEEKGNEVHVNIVNNE